MKKTFVALAISFIAGTAFAALDPIEALRYQ